MRLWHYKLIPLLPNAQLKAMRYEIGDMVKQYPNIKNRLVSYANDYEAYTLWSYFEDVLEEFDKRNIKHNSQYDNKIKKIVLNKTKNPLDLYNWYKFNEHNDRYLKQCYFNLQEKYDRGIISEKEWQKIYCKYKFELLGGIND